MQSFLPYPPEIDKETGNYSFRNSARVLDPVRLNKQCTEGYQILKCLLIPSSSHGWKHHPAVLQWKGHELSLLQYVLDMCNEHVSRGGKTSIIEKVRSLNISNRDESLPKWMGTEAIHSSHRSRLLFKGRVDAAIETLKEDVGIIKPYKWLTENGYPKPNLFELSDVERLETEIYRTVKILSLRFNYYTTNDFGWKEWIDNSLSYVWPVTIAQIREEQKS